MIPVPPYNLVLKYLAYSYANFSKPPTHYGLLALVRTATARERLRMVFPSSWATAVSCSSSTYHPAGCPLPLFPWPIHSWCSRRWYIILAYYLWLTPWLLVKLTWTVHAFINDALLCTYTATTTSTKPSSTKRLAVSWQLAVQRPFYSLPCSTKLPYLYCLVFPIVAS